MSFKREVNQYVNQEIQTQEAYHPVTQQQNTAIPPSPKLNQIFLSNQYQNQGNSVLTAPSNTRQAVPNKTPRRILSPSAAVHRPALTSLCFQIFRSSSDRSVQARNFSSSEMPL